MRISRRRDGSFNVKLPEAERELVIGLVGQLRELLVADDAPGLERLFPPAYADDEEREREYRSLVHDELLEKRFAALDIVEATVQETRLDEGQLTAWMGAVNDVRLVLGTILDVSEEMDEIDPGDPRAGSFAVYGYLTHLLAQIVGALANW
jgi:hypothetical protein